MKQQKKKTVLCLLAGLALCGVFLSLTAGEPATALEGSEVQPLSNQTTGRSIGCYPQRWHSYGEPIL